MAHNGSHTAFCSTFPEETGPFLEPLADINISHLPLLFLWRKMVASLESASKQGIPFTAVRDQFRMDQIGEAFIDCAPNRGEIHVKHMIHQTWKAVINR